VNGRPIVSLRSLTKVYHLGSVEVRALDRLSLDIRGGEFVAIMGPSGSGKSTLLNILGCLDRPTDGSYVLGGEDVSTLRDNQLSDRRCRFLGFVFQSYNLIPQLTVLENIEIPLFYQGLSPRKSRHRALALAQQVGLEDRTKHRPVELSGGQQQRVAIARALANDPLVILADEPTGNLDSATGEEIMEVIRSLHRQGKTIVLVTHDVGISDTAERVINLRDGRILSEKDQKRVAPSPD
jgi:putative ABC transport system ATP-binding protein